MYCGLNGVNSPFTAANVLKTKEKHKKTQISSTANPFQSAPSPVLLVDLGLFDAFVLGAPVLEPDLDLRLGQLEHLGQLEAAPSGNVLVAVKFHFEAQGLLAAESGPLAAWTAFLFPPACHCK